MKSLSTLPATNSTKFIPRSLLHVCDCLSKVAFFLRAWNYPVKAEKGLGNAMVRSVDRCYKKISMLGDE